MTRAPAHSAGWLAGVAVCACFSFAEAQAPLPAAAGTCWVRGDPAGLAARRSPLDSVTAWLGGVEVKVCYSRPSARGRTIMGGLVPYGRPWRLGADEATTLHLPVPLRFGDLRLPAGVYSLYAIPGAAQWEIVANGSAQRWGVPIGAPVRAADVGSITVAPEPTEARVEQLTLRLEPVTADRLALVAEWEHTRIRVLIERP